MLIHLSHFPPPTTGLLPNSESTLTPWSHLHVKARHVRATTIFASLTGSWLSHGRYVALPGSTWLLRGTHTPLCRENRVAWFLKDSFTWRCNPGVEKWNKELNWIELNWHYPQAGLHCIDIFDMPGEWLLNRTLFVSQGKWTVQYCGRLGDWV